MTAAVFGAAAIFKVQVSIVHVMDGYLSGGLEAFVFCYW